MMENKNKINYDFNHSSSHYHVSLNFILSIVIHFVFTNQINRFCCFRKFQALAQSTHRLKSLITNF
jgi:hypothetical protein